MDKPIKANARVKVLLEVSLSDSWDMDCQLNQVYKQAKDSAINIVSQKIAGGNKNIRIIGEPEIVAVLVENKRP